VAANIGAQAHPLPANGHIELSFDRLLLPASVTRQTFVLENAGGTVGYTPAIAYDPVARVVTIAPLADPDQALMPGQDYQLLIVTPQSATDPNGLRAIDGATLDPMSPHQIAFAVTAADGTPPTAPSMDYCRDIKVVFELSCELQSCHGFAVPLTPAEGLLLDTPTDIRATAIGHVAHEANTGPRSVAEPPSLLFGEDMPIIDQGADPGNSWMMYKFLLAVPSPEAVVDAGEDASVEAAAGSATPEASAGDAGVADASAGDAGVADAAPPFMIVPPVDVSHAHQLAWAPLSDADRAILSNYVIGLEMPYPQSYPPLTLSQMERMSLWISQGSMMPATCP
jgi:hypothetical protein